MSEKEIIKLADEANIIVNGYAFFKKEDGVSVLNLNNPEHAAFFSINYELIEYSLDEIELDIVKKYLEQSKAFLED